jgi:hypothetical protein
MTKRNMNNALSQTDLWTLRGLVQKCGWGEFMRHIGSLMAEQADKVPRDSEEDKNLFNCSRTIHALDEFFEKCGQFDYRVFEPMINQEALQILNQYPPLKKM